MLARLAERDPAVHQRLAQVELFDFAYLSDGLRVKGVLARPRGAGPFPGVIYNRGGNRVSGALTPAYAASLLGASPHGATSWWPASTAATPGRGRRGVRRRGHPRCAAPDPPARVSLPGPTLVPHRHVRLEPRRPDDLPALAATDRMSAAVIGGGMSDASTP